MGRRPEGGSGGVTARFLPAAFALHVLEEAPEFPAWARRHASPRYSHRDFVANNAFGFALTALSG